jgi:hypothetical protein
MDVCQLQRVDDGRRARKVWGQRQGDKELSLYVGCDLRKGHEEGA